MDTYHILGKDVYVSNNTRSTRPNNNDLIIGPSGRQKTRNCVMPNIARASESMIIADTKCNLRKEFGFYLAQTGYQVYDIDFADLDKSLCGSSLSDFIGYSAKDYKFCEQDIKTISAILVPVASEKEPYWKEAVQMCLEALIAYTLMRLPKEQRNLSSVADFVSQNGSSELKACFDELNASDSGCFAARRFCQMKTFRIADRMDASIKGIIFEGSTPYLLMVVIRCFPTQEEWILHHSGK